MFNAENCIRRFSWSAVCEFGAIHCWNACRSLKLQKKITKIPYFGVKGRSRSSMLVPPESSSAVLVMQQVGAYLQPFSRSHAGRLIDGKITILKGVHLFDALVRGENLCSQRHERWSQETRYSTLSYGENRCHSLTWAWFGTGTWHQDRQTYWRTDGQNYDSQYALNTTCCRA